MAKKDAIVYIDPFSKTLLKVTQNHFEKTTSIKGYFTGSRVNFEDIITLTFKVNSNISKGDLDVTVELKMYEDMGLKTDKEYKIVYLKKPLDYEDSFIIEAFAIDIELYKEKLSFVLERSKNLDFLAIPPLCFESLYIHKIIAPKKDIFIYIGDDEAFISIYKDGSYLSSSSLPNLYDILKKLKEKNIDISLDDLKKILKYKGLDKSRYDIDTIEIYDVLFTIFSDIFYKIGNIAMHNRSVFGFDEIETIYFSTSEGKTRGLRELAYSVGFENSKLMDFDFFKQERDSLFFEKIAALYIYEKFKNKDNSLNLTFTKKKKAFYKTKAGQFIIFFIVALLAFSSYPLYLFYQNGKLSQKEQTLEQRYQELKFKTSKIKREIVKSKVQIKKLKTQIEQQNKRMQNIDKSVKELIALTSKDKKLHNDILLINDLLKKYNLALKSYKELDGNNITLQIVAKYNQRDNIAKFMKELIDKNFVEVSTKEIKLDNSYYISEIKISK